jgi:hypothetical protein
MKRQFFIAGVQFRPRVEINQATKNMVVGDKLFLSPEPTNNFDPNAVQIIAKRQMLEHEVAGSFSEVFLGYVPKRFSSEVSAMLGIGAPIICTVDEVNPEGKTYEMIKVTVQIPIAEEDKDIDEADDEGPYSGEDR